MPWAWHWRGSSQLGGEGWGEEGRSQAASRATEALLFSRHPSLSRKQANPKLGRSPRLPSAGGPSRNVEVGLQGLLSPPPAQSLSLSLYKGGEAMSKQLGALRRRSLLGSWVATASPGPQSPTPFPGPHGASGGAEASFLLMQCL